MQRNSATLGSRVAERSSHAPHVGSGWQIVLGSATVRKEWRIIKRFCHIVLTSGGLPKVIRHSVAKGSKCSHEIATLSREWQVR